MVCSVYGTGLLSGLFRVLFGSKTFSFGFSKCSKQPGRLVLPELAEGSEPRKVVTKRVGDQTPELPNLGLVRDQYATFSGTSRSLTQKGTSETRFSANFTKTYVLPTFFSS